MNKSNLGSYDYNKINTDSIVQNTSCFINLLNYDAVINILLYIPYKLIYQDLSILNSRFYNIINHNIDRNKLEFNANYMNDNKIYNNLYSINIIASTLILKNYKLFH